MLKTHIYAFAEACGRLGPEWQNAVAAVADRLGRKGPVRPPLDGNIYHLLLVACEPRNGTRCDGTTKLSDGTRYRIVRDLMIAEQWDVPVEHLIGFLHQIGAEGRKSGPDAMFDHFKRFSPKEYLRRLERESGPN
jgi:hypothetical protein